VPIAEGTFEVQVVPLEDLLGPCSFVSEVKQWASSSLSWLSGNAVSIASCEALADCCIVTF
jgi:hypothetical protein